LTEFPVMYFISAFGYQAKIYELRTQPFEILPHAIPRSDPRKIENLAPIDGWNVDILSYEGAQVLRAVAEHTHRCATACNILLSQ
jgi:hypothetical protein